MMMHPLYPLFHPHVIAVIGASDRYGSLGRAVFGQLLTHGVAEQIIPINLQHKTVGGIKAYASLTEMSEELVADTAIIVLAADKVANIVREAIKCAVKNIILINESEQLTPQNRAKLERASELAQKANIRLLAIKMSSLDGLFHREQGNCAYIGQSAGIADCLLNYAKSRGMNFNRFITLNPQPNDTVSTGQVIDFVASEPETDALLVHISTLDNTRELLSALKAASRKKSVFVLSTLPESEEEMLFQQALRRNKIFTVYTLAEFLTVSKLLYAGAVANGRRLGIISNTQQISALSLKLLPQLGLELAQSNASTQRALNKILPYKLSSHQPLYLSADTAPSVFQAATELFLQDDQMDAVCVMYAGVHPVESRRVAQMLSGLQTRYPRKPLFFIWLGSANHDETRNLFNQNKNLHFRQPEDALYALVQLNRYRDYRHTRHYTTSFYDYRRAAQIAHKLRAQLAHISADEEKIPTSQLANVLGGLQKHFRQPNNATPTDKTWLDPICYTLQVPLQETGSAQLQLTWRIQAPFGQTLTLATDTESFSLLPPITPNMVAKALHHLNLPNTVWQDWLLQTCDVLCRLPEIHAFQIALQHDSQNGLRGFNADMELNPNPTPANAFTPYPFECEEIVLLKNAKLLLRPVRPEDADLIKQHVSLMSDASREMRFISKSKELPPSLLAQFTQVDYSREFALILQDPQLRPLALASYTADECGNSCEFGISLLDEMQGRGVGRLLMERLIKRAKLQGFHTMRAEILADNHAMQKLSLRLGFLLSKHPHDPSMVEAHLTL